MQRSRKSYLELVDPGVGGLAGFLVKGDWWEMEAASASQSRIAEWKSMRFHGKCQPGLTFWRLQPPESERRGRGRGGGQEIRGDEVERKKEIRMRKTARNRTERRKY